MSNLYHERSFSWMFSSFMINISQLKFLEIISRFLSANISIIFILSVFKTLTVGVIIPEDSHCYLYLPEC